MKKRILGIDTGTNSLGWAVVDRDSNGTCSLVSKGSLIFQEGVKVEKGIESSKAAERTSHRALRKQYFRRRLRKIRVLWLEQGLIYPHAVLMAKVPDIVGEDVWQSRGEYIAKELSSSISNFNPKDVAITGTLDVCIKDTLKDICSLAPGAADKLYHPSMIDVYPDARKNPQGVYQLGSPRTNAVRNPMAMRSLHQLRKVINALLRDGTIDSQTEVHIEYARELNDANKRWAISQWNKERETLRKKYAEDIRTLYKKDTGKDIVPTEDDIVKFQLWEEQKHICLYTGNSIGITEFIGPNPSYDIEHTVPRSAGGDSTLENMTLCSSKFNRDVKKTKLPTQLPDYEDILQRLEGWREKIEKLRKDVDRVKTHSGMDKAVKDRLIRKRHLLRLDLDYWVGKYKRFQMTEVPEGFARRQGAGIGLVGKYAGLYLKSLFHKADDRNKSNVRVVKGATTAEYRKMWGIQDENEKKSRDNHVHHCIDAIVIACIEPSEYGAIKGYYLQLEDYERARAAKPTFPKPWPTFTEDIKAIAQEMIVVHSTPDNMPKHARKYVQTANGRKLAKGDSARGSLHNDTYYGAIERDGEIKYVLRKELSSLKESDVENIVDEAVKQKVKQAIAERGFKDAMAGDIFMNKEKGIKIKKVRCFTPTVTNPLHIRTQRDVSKKEYKRQFHVTLDGNYCMAIYEGVVKGKMKRSYEIINMLDAAAYFKKSADQTKLYPIAPESKNGLKFRCTVRTGTQVILLQSDDEEINLDDKAELARRFYFVAVMRSDGRIVLRYNQEARDATTLKKERKSGAYKMNEQYRSEIMLSLSDFHALVEDVDFKINVLGEIVMMK